KGPVAEKIWWRMSQPFRQLEIRWRPGHDATRTRGPYNHFTFWAGNVSIGPRNLKQGHHVKQRHCLRRVPECLQNLHEFSVGDARRFRQVSKFSLVLRPELRLLDQFLVAVAEILICLRRASIGPTVPGILWHRSLLVISRSSLKEPRTAGCPAETVFSARRERSLRGTPPTKAAQAAARETYMPPLKHCSGRQLQRRPHRPTAADYRRRS